MTTSNDVSPRLAQYALCDARFMTAREKQLVLRAWARFLKNELCFADFTDRLYQHLTLHCSFIAHYDRVGFYRTYFANGEDTVRFFTQFDKRGSLRSVEYGSTWWLEGDYGDLNKAMVEEAARYIPKLIKAAETRQREADIVRAKRLLAKHGLRPENLR